jgi:hypothetical protein
MQASKMGSFQAQSGLKWNIASSPPVSGLFCALKKWKTETTRPARITTGCTTSFATVTSSGRTSVCTIRRAITSH